MEMKNIFEILDGINNSLETGLPASNHKAMHQYQEKMLAQYQQISVPSSKIKTWTKISKKTIDDGGFQLASSPEVTALNVNDAAKIRSGKLIISEDAIQVWMDEHLQAAGAVFCDIATAFEAHAEIFQKALDEQELSHIDKVSAFTAGMSRHGFFLYLPKGIVLEQPIEVVVRLTSNKTVLPIIAVVVMEDQVSAGLIIRNQSAKNNKNTGVVLVNRLIHIGEHSILRIMENQRFGKRNWFYTDERLTLDSQAELKQLVLDEGSEVSKRHLSVTLSGEGSQAMITGIYTPGTKQNFVYDTHQNHLASHTNSDLLFSGVLHEDAYSLWQGNVYVAEGTRGADGFQINKNLLLDESVHAESVPGLEIVADDVRCSHAVTLSSVDPDQIFYLKSRGIDYQDAEELIVNGFLEAAATRIKDKMLLKMAQEELG